MTKVKICGLKSRQDIEYVNQAKPDYAGFVFAPGKRQIDAETAAYLRPILSKQIISVGVFKDAEESLVLRLADQKIIDMIQLHGEEASEYMNRIKTRLPVPVIKAISVGNTAQEDLIREYQEAGCDFFLFDQGGGGTGKTFDWNRLPYSPRPYFIAGGIHAGNVIQAMKLKPYAVDISSGVETSGCKDAAKIVEIVKLVKDNS